MYGEDFINQEIEYKDLLNSNQLHIWWWLLGHSIEVGEHFCNPFRLDDHPGCWLKWKGNYLRLQDYADKEYHNLSIFDATIKKYSLSFKDCLIKIVNECNIDVKEKSFQPLKKKISVKNNQISIIQGKWTNLAKQYWKPLDITKNQLIEDKVVFTDRIIVNGIMKQVSNPTFTYWFKSGNCKIHQPLGTMKWFTNININDIGNLENLPLTGDNLIITKSYKDHRIIKNLGYNCIWLNNEGMGIPDTIIKDLKLRFRNIYILFDNDKAGIKASKKLCKLYNLKLLTFPLELRSYIYNCYFLNIPKFGITDTAEYYTNLGSNQTKKFFEENIN